MRKLVWFSLGFGAACCLCAYVLTGSVRVILTVAGGVLTLLTAIAGRKFTLFRRIAAILLGLAMGMGWFTLYDGFYLSAAGTMDGKTADAVIRVSDYSYETAYGIGVDGTVQLEGKSYRIRAYLDLDEPLEPGDVISGQFRFRATTPKENRTYHAGNGIFLLAYQADKASVSPHAGAFWRDFPPRLRHRIQEILQTCIPQDAAPFARALLLGDTTDLSYGVDTSLKISGIRHVAAVSGLHVSILFALLTAITFRKRFLTALVGFPTLLLFAAVAGFTPSVSRSCIMCALMLAALLLNKEYDGPAALSFAAVVMLIGNPLVITSVGFQLSVASVAGIYLFAPGIRKWLVSLFPDGKGKGVRPTLIRWFTASVSITLSAMIFTTPLSAWYFGTVSLVGVVTNLLTLWVISFIFYGLVAVSLAGAFWTGGAMILGKIVAWPIRYVLFVAKLLAGFPLAAVYTRSPYITIWLVAVYVLLLLVFLLSRNRRPGVLLCCGTLGLCLALLASWAEPMLDDTRVTVLDVGQGQCILLQSEGRTCMVDCGGDSDTETADIAAETLLSQGISRLDGLILTHGDRDHTGAAENLLSRVKADVLILPPEEGMPVPDNAEVVYAEQDLILTYGKTNLHIFAADSHGSENENSLCVLFDTENCDILITGDRSAYGERMLLHAGKIPEVDVLVAGHHGSKNSTCEDLLAAARPQTVCISAGKDNLYGHPAAETLQRLESFGCTVYRTDRDGTITIRR